ncbi:hypothetical protein MAR_002193, partial [Mya arenaria]
MERKDRIRFCGGILVYIRDDLPFRRRTDHVWGWTEIIALMAYYQTIFIKQKCSKIRIQNSTHPSIEAIKSENPNVNVFDFKPVDNKYVHKLLCNIDSKKAT